MPKRYLAMGVSALIFDFDGTLARQTLDYSIMKREAIKAVREFVHISDRPDLPTMELLDLVDTSTEKGDKALKAALAAIQRVEIEAAKKSGLFPFVRPMLARFRELGLTMGIVTRNCHEGVTTVFPDVYDHGIVLTRDDVPKIKPDPAHLEAAQIGRAHV